MAQVVYDHEEIIAMARKGYSGPTIKQKLQSPISVRQVQRIMAKHRLKEYAQAGRIKADNYTPGPFRDMVVALMIERGQDPKRCSLCGMKQWKTCDIHHTKYEGATVNDLVFACRKCNLAPENVGLA